MTVARHSDFELDAARLVAGAPPRTDRHLRVTVAALTRQRPAMLAELLDSFGGLVPPANCTVRFLIVENDDEPRSRDEIERRGGRIGECRLDYVLEPEPGIPFGRNRAAKEAIRAGHDLLAFVDDDEIVDPAWLKNLIDGYRNSDAVLLGAPLAIQPPLPGLSRSQRAMHACIRRRYLKKERRAARRSDLTGTRRTTIVTNNWLAETAIFTGHGLWFDETMRFTGGTDAKFYAEARAKGLPTAWISNAHVYEGIPPERLDFWYQFRRGRDQSTTNFHRKIEKTPAAKWTVLITVPPKAVAVVVLAGLLLPTGGATALELSRTMGWIAGRIGALAGRKSSLYLETTGH